jgi:O-methyltransferase involved in polyketide biosynthesis
MNSINKTLYIPLYGKALVSKKGIIINDKTAEIIWESAGFKLKGKSKSKWLAYFMAMRSKVFDCWVYNLALKNPNAVIIHLGCGLDSRINRLNLNNLFYDVDFSAVIFERKKYFSESKNYKMIESDIEDVSFINKLEKRDNAIVVIEGVSMYLENESLKNTLIKLANYYKSISVLVDCYTPFAVKMSKLKNPIKDVGASTVYGVENPLVLESDKVKFIKEHSLTPDHLINELNDFERVVFKKLYAGKTAQKLYKLYEYES